MSDLRSGKLISNDILDIVLKGDMWPLSELPEEQGIYALADHTDAIRYIGSTTMTIRRRVHQYHVTGDDNSVVSQFEIADLLNCVPALSLSPQSS